MDCNIIRDLFPSYIDGICSPESRSCVQDHINECMECRERLVKIPGYMEYQIFLEEEWAKKHDYVSFVTLKSKYPIKKYSYTVNDENGKMCLNLQKSIQHLFLELVRATMRW